MLDIPAKSNDATFLFVTWNRYLIASMEQEAKNYQNIICFHAIIVYWPLINSLNAESLSHKKCKCLFF